MATRKPTERKPGVVFTAGAAERIARVVRTVERGGVMDGAAHWGYRPDESGEVFKLARTTVVFAKGTAKVITVYSGPPLAEVVGSPAETVTAYNKFADVPANKWVMLGLMAGNWYVIAAEC